MSSTIKENELLKKFIKIWDRVSNSFKKGFYKSVINTNFYHDEIPREDSHFICLLVILNDSVFKIGKNYYP